VPHTRDARESASRDTESEYLDENDNIWFCIHLPSAPSTILIKITNFFLLKLLRTSHTAHVPYFFQNLFVFFLHSLCSLSGTVENVLDYFFLSFSNFFMLKFMFELQNNINNFIINNNVIIASLVFEQFDE